MKLLDRYLVWLKNQFSEAEANGWTELITPYLDKNNDHIQIYLQERGEKILITDDGQTLSNLELNGFLRTDKRLEIMATIFRGFQVEWTEDAKIELNCSRDEFPSRFHALMQTITAVDGLGYMTRENIRSMFLEDVAALLNQNEITYHANYEVQGKSGLAVTFPFFIPNHKSYHATHVQLINQPKTNLKNYLFEWSDTEDSRSESKCIALINDSYITPNRSALRALEKYDVVPILWSNKDKFISEIAS